jgi:hypothetical protein
VKQRVLQCAAWRLCWGSQYAAALCALLLHVFSPGGESRELWQVLALLYKGQGRPDLSLAIYLQLQLPSVFDFIQVRTSFSHASDVKCASRQSSVGVCLIGPLA